MRNEYEEPKHAEEAERCVIASAVSDPDGGIYDELSSIVQPEDFFDSRCRNIFNCLGDIINSGEEISEITLIDQLRRQKLLDDSGGVPFVMTIMDSPTTRISGLSASRIVRTHSQNRKLTRLYRQQLEKLKEDEDPIHIASKTEAGIRDIMDTCSSSVANLSDSAMELKNRLKSISDGTYVSKKISTGIPHLDEKLDEGGIGFGEVMVLAAPTSCGKSQLALNFVLRASITDNIPSAIFSFEMPANQLTKRMTQASSAVNLKRYTEGTITPVEDERVNTAIDKLGSAPIYTEHSVRGIDDLRSKARSLKRKHDVKIIVVDYLQLIPYNPKLSKHEGISQASHGIKQMAMELDVVVILLAQINRTGAMRDTGLVLYDLKDSGDIENDADIALLMWPRGGDMDSCKVMLKGGESYLEMDYNIAKNREGERDLKGRFKFLNHIGRFK
jgi:replicative DNA helicase